MRQALVFVFWPTLAGVLAAVLILQHWLLPAGKDTGGTRERASYAGAVSTATPSVVNIYTTKLVTEQKGSPLLQDRYFRPPTESRGRRRHIERSLGSGVVVTARGHILTNNHVIAGADAIQVMLHDGRSANAVVIGTDSPTDLAVLKVDLPNLEPIELGDSEDIRVGDVVLAIGNPLGFEHSVTQGIISALGRYGLRLTTYEDYIQTDATIHPGNSGGALIDTSGRLLGINTLIYTGNDPRRNNVAGIGIGLAIPVNLAIFVMQDLIDYGEVIRGWLGVMVEPIAITAESEEPQPALSVVSVTEGSPAEKAGIAAGDVITHIDGVAVRDGRRTMHRIARLRPGDAIEISVRRARQSLELRAIVGVQTQSSQL